MTWNYLRRKRLGKRVFVLYVGRDRPFSLVVLVAITCMLSSANPAERRMQSKHIHIVLGWIASATGGTVVSLDPRRTSLRIVRPGQDR